MTYREVIIYIKTSPVSPDVPQPLYFTFRGYREQWGLKALLGTQASRGWKAFPDRKDTRGTGAGTDPSEQRATGYVVG